MDGQSIGSDGWSEHRFLMDGQSIGSDGWSEHRF